VTQGSPWGRFGLRVPPEAPSSPTQSHLGPAIGLGQIEQIGFGSERSDTDGGRGWGTSFAPKGGSQDTPCQRLLGSITSST
jgi:hypothetical protein